MAGTKRSIWLSIREELTGGAYWRHRQAEKFQNEPRNLEAVAIIERLLGASDADIADEMSDLLGPFQEKDVVWNDALVSAIKSVGFETFPRDMGEFLHSLYGELLTYEADLIDAAVRKLECFEAAAVAKLDGKTATSGPSPLRPDWMRITAQTVTELIEKDTPTDELRVYFEWAMRKADMFASEPVEIAPGLWGRSSSPEGIDMMQRLFAHVGNPTAMA